MIHLIGKRAFSSASTHCANQRPFLSPFGASLITGCFFSYAIIISSKRNTEIIYWKLDEVKKEIKKSNSSSMNGK
jgi:hypothetical protein